MRVELAGDPAVMRLTKMTGLDRFSVIGRLHALWSWFDVNSACGEVEFVDADDIANVVGSRDFVDALCKISWLKIKKSSAILPKFAVHNGSTAKERSQKNQRQARWRERKTVDAPPSTPVDKKTSTREEKRREDIKPSAREAVPVDNLRTLQPKTDGNRLPKAKGNGNGQGQFTAALGKAWGNSMQAIQAKGQELGIQAHAGESIEAYRERLFAAIELSKRESA